jgi:hypothetical protein
MARIYFHCVGDQRVLVDRNGHDLEDLIDIEQLAVQVAHSCIAKPDDDDWRAWTVLVSNDGGEEIFTLPFAAVIGRLH